MTYRPYRPMLPSLARSRGSWPWRCVALLWLSWPLLASDAADTFVLAQAQPSTPGLVCESMDADFIAVPLTLEPSGDTMVAIYEHLQKCRAALQAAFKEPYRVSLQPRSFPSDDAMAIAAGATAVAQTSSSGAATLPSGMHFSLIIVRPLTQLDPEQVPSPSSASSRRWPRPPRSAQSSRASTASASATRSASAMTCCCAWSATPSSAASPCPSRARPG